MAAAQLAMLDLNLTAREVAFDLNLTPPEELVDEMDEDEPADDQDAVPENNQDEHENDDQDAVQENDQGTVTV